MPLIALTRSNIGYVKRCLRPVYREVRSAHLSEAIATACGFRTNIAMVTRLRVQNPHRPDLAEFDEGRLDFRLRELGESAIKGIRPDNLVGSLELPDRIWARCKDKDIPSKDLWFRECQRLDIPYVVVSTRRALADVIWDCIALNIRHDAVLASKNSRPVQRMFERFQAIAGDKPGKPIFDGTSFVGTIRRVPMQMAPQLADAVFRILYDCVLEGEREASSTGVGGASDALRPWIHVGASRQPANKSGQG